MQTIVLLALFIVGSISVPGKWLSEAEFSDPYQFSSQITPNYLLEWNLSETTVSFQVTITPGNVWGGIGFHSVGSTNTGMDSADIFTGVFFPNNTMRVDDRWSKSEQLPSTDASIGTSGCVDSVIEGSASGLTNANTTIFRFSRLINTGDAHCDVVFAPGTINVIWAHGRTNNFNYHGSSNRGQTQLSIIPPSPTTSEISTTSSTTSEASTSGTASTTQSPSSTSTTTSQGSSTTSQSSSTTSDASTSGTASTTQSPSSTSTTTSQGSSTTSQSSSTTSDASTSGINSLTTQEKIAVSIGIVTLFVATAIIVSSLLIWKNTRGKKIPQPSETSPLLQ